MVSFHRARRVNAEVEIRPSQGAGGGKSTHVNVITEMTLRETEILTCFRREEPSKI